MGELKEAQFDRDGEALVLRGTELVRRVMDGYNRIRNVSFSTFGKLTAFADTIEAGDVVYLDDGRRSNGANLVYVRAPQDSTADEYGFTPIITHEMSDGSPYEQMFVREYGVADGYRLVKEYSIDHQGGSIDEACYGKWSEYDGRELLALLEAQPDSQGQPA